MNIEKTYKKLFIIFSDFNKKSNEIIIPKNKDKKIKSNRKIKKIYLSFNFYDTNIYILDKFIVLLNNFNNFHLNKIIKKINHNILINNKIIISFSILDFSEKGSFFDTLNIKYFEYNNYKKNYYIQNVEKIKNYKSYFENLSKKINFEINSTSNMLYDEDIFIRTNNTQRNISINRELMIYKIITTYFFKSLLNFKLIYVTNKKYDY